MKNKLLIVIMLIMVGCASVDKPPVAAVERNADGIAISATDKELQEKPAEGYAQQTKANPALWDWLIGIDWVQVAASTLGDALADPGFYYGWVWK